MANSVFDNLTVAEMRAVAKAYGVKLGPNISKEKLLAHLNDSIIDKPSPEELLEMGIDCNKSVHRGRPPKVTAAPAEAAAPEEMPAEEKTEEPVEESAEIPPEPAVPEEPAAKPADLKAHTQGLTFSSAWVNKDNGQNGNGKSNWNRSTQRPLVTPHSSATGADPLRPPVAAPTNFKPRFGPGSNARSGEDFRRPEPQARTGFGPRRPENGFIHNTSSADNTDEPQTARPAEQSNTRIVTGNPLPQPQKPASVPAEQVAELLQPANLREAEGVLELHPDGYGFLHSKRTYQAASTDIYVSAAIIHRYDLRMGDYVKGKVRPHRDTDRYEALVYLLEINGAVPEGLAARPRFEDLTPCYPSKRILVDEASDALKNALLLAPIGFGSRVLIRCSETPDRMNCLAELTNKVQKANPTCQVMLLLIDARPEDVTALREKSDCDILASSFETPTELTIRQIDLVIERTKRLTEGGKDVILIVDSLSRLLTLPSVSNNNVLKAKKLFGSARATKEAGTLTVIGVMEELPKEMGQLSAAFCEAANTELVLKHDFSQIDRTLSYCRHPELLLLLDEQAEADALRGGEKA